MEPPNPEGRRFRARKRPDKSRISMRPGQSAGSRYSNVMVRRTGWASATRSRGTRSRPGGGAPRFTGESQTSSHVSENLTLNASGLPSRIPPNITIRSATGEYAAAGRLLPRGAKPSTGRGVHASSPELGAVAHAKKYG